VLSRGATDISDLALLLSLDSIVNTTLIQDPEELFVCPRRVFGDFAIVQPCFGLEGTAFRVCSVCAYSCFSGDWIRPVQNPPLQDFVCQAKEAIDVGLGFVQPATAPGAVLDPFSSTGLYVRRKLRSRAIAAQPTRMVGNSEGEASMVSSLRSGCQTVRSS
jgi:hypothetical protein